jgi:hypothetical protein
MLPVYDISKKYSMSESSIRKIIGRDIRPISGKKEFNLPTMDIIHKYIEDNQSILEISSYYRVSEKTIKRRLTSNNVTLRGKNQLRRSQRGLPTHSITYDYIINNMSPTALGRKYGVSGMTIKKCLLLNNIGIRDKVESHKCLWQRPDISTDDIVRDYFSKVITKKEMKEKYKCAYGTLTNRIKAAGRLIRSRSDAGKAFWGSLTQGQISSKIGNLLKRVYPKPTNPEIELLNILDAAYPNQWRYVGDGSALIGRKNPDFINIFGHKAIIEMFGTYWHSKEHTGIDDELHANSRCNHFAEFGYSALIVWQSELANIDKLKYKIEEFYNKVKEEI